MVEKDDFDSLLRLLLSIRDKDSLQTVIEGLAEIIVHPKIEGSIGHRMDVSSTRVKTCLALENKQIVDLMFKLSDKFRLGENKEILSYIIRHGGASKLYQHIMSRNREYWRDGEASRGHVFQSTLFLDWIIESGNLLDLFKRIDQEEFFPWEITDIWGSLLMLILIDRVCGQQYKALSGITGDTKLALEILKRAKNEHHHYATGNDPFTFVVGVSGLEEALIDLLANKCSEEAICDALTKCSCFRSIEVLCWVLQKIGSKKSLNTLERVPRDVPSEDPDYCPRTTESSIYMAISGICERMNTSELKEATLQHSEYVKKELSKELERRSRPPVLPKLASLIEMKDDLETDYLLSIISNKIENVSKDIISFAAVELISRKCENSIMDLIKNRKIKLEEGSVIFAKLFTDSPCFACQCLEYLFNSNETEERKLLIECLNIINADSPPVTKFLIEIHSKVTNQLDINIRIGIIGALKRVALEMPGMDLFLIFSEAKSDPNSKIRLIALAAFAEIWPEKAAEPMLAALDDPEPEIRDYAMTALTDILNLRPEQKLVIAEKCCKSCDFKLRAKSIEILSKLNDSISETIVLKMLDDNDDNVVIKAVHALGKIGAARSIALLENKKKRFSDMQWLVDDAIAAIRERL